MKTLTFVLTLALAGAAFAAEPIAFGDPSLAPLAASQRFGAEMAVRYPQGADFAGAKADAEANGFRCETLQRFPGAPSHECVRVTREGGCSREWAIELREDGGQLRAPAVGSFARLCVGAVLPAKQSKAYQKPK